MLNQVILRGRLVKEVEVIKAKGMTIGKFTLAHKETKDKTIFVSCVAFNEKVEVITKYVNKGDDVIIQGRISQSTGKETKITYTSIIVDKVELISKPKKKELEVTPMGNEDIEF